MELHLILNHLFPVNAPGDWHLQNDGDGPYISAWNRVEPQPTEAQMLNAVPAMLAADVKRSAANKIQAMESQYLLPRAVREFMLGALKAEAAKVGLDPMALPAYVKVKALDDQIAALRAQL